MFFLIHEFWTKFETCNLFSVWKSLNAELLQGQEKSEKTKKNDKSQVKMGVFDKSQETWQNLKKTSSSVSLNFTNS